MYLPLAFRGHATGAVEEVRPFEAVGRITHVTHTAFSSAIGFVAMSLGLTLGLSARDLSSSLDLM
jgi:hypothetical protein